MGAVDSWIDYAVTGEADDAFPALLDTLAVGADPMTGPCAVSRRGRTCRARASAVPFEELDSQPVPDYDEYFERAVALGLLEEGKARDIDLPYESARGCWWGERRHCTFCGLNGSTMRFRSKSPARVRRELEELTRRYGSFRMEALDNILDLSYLDELLAPLAAQGAAFELFYEIKANLSRADMKRLADGGLYRIQPGIESLNSHLLALMQKGIRAAHNVNTLRWATYYGIGVGWNILCGFPGETEADYAEQAALMRHLVHLPPPIACAPISIDRFSPTFEDRDRFPVRDLRPGASYAVVYPPHVDLMAAAYHFEGELDGVLGDAAYAATSAAAEDWRSAWKLAPHDETPSLTFWWAPSTLHIEDRRWPDRVGTYAFEDPLAALYVACSDAPVKAIDVAKVTDLVDRVDEVEGALDEFCRLGLMMRDGNLFLALALPARRGPLTRHADGRPGWEAVEKGRWFERPLPAVPPSELVVGVVLDRRRERMRERVVDRLDEVCRRVAGAALCRDACSVGRPARHREVGESAGLRLDGHRHHLRPRPSRRVDRPLDLPRGLVPRRLLCHGR